MKNILISIFWLESSIQIHYIKYTIHQVQLGNACSPIWSSKWSTWSPFKDFFHQQLQLLHVNGFTSTSILSKATLRIWDQPTTNIRGLLGVPWQPPDRRPTHETSLRSKLKLKKVDSQSKICKIKKLDPGNLTVHPWKMMIGKPLSYPKMVRCQGLCWTFGCRFAEIVLRLHKFRFHQWPVEYRKKNVVLIVSNYRIIFSCKPEHKHVDLFLSPHHFAK